MNSIKKNSKESLKYSTCIDVFWVHVFKKNSWRISGTINKIQWKYYGNAWTFPLVPIHRRGFSLFSASPSATLQLHSWKTESTCISCWTLFPFLMELLLSPQRRHQIFFGWKRNNSHKIQISLAYTCIVFCKMCINIEI